MNKTERIIVSLDGYGTGEAQKVAYDSDDDEHREILSESFDTTFGTWQSLTLEGAKALLEELKGAIEGEATDIKELV